MGLDSYFQGWNGLVLKPELLVIETLNLGVLIPELDAPVNRVLW